MACYIRLSLGTDQCVLTSQRTTVALYAAHARRGLQLMAIIRRRGGPLLAAPWRMAPRHRALKSSIFLDSRQVHFRALSTVQLQLQKPRTTHIPLLYHDHLSF